MPEGLIARKLLISYAQLEFNRTISPYSDPFIAEELQIPHISNSPDPILPYAYSPNSQKLLCDAVLGYINRELMEDDCSENETATTMVPTINSSPLFVKEFQIPQISNSPTPIVPRTYRPNSQKVLCDTVLQYISRELMEDDDCEDEATIVKVDATKRSFHEIIASASNPHDEEGDAVARIGNDKRLADNPNEYVIHDMFGKMMSLYGDYEDSTFNGCYHVLPRMVFNKREATDMRNLLLQCMQFVASSDYTSASELLKEIRPHTSISGDGTQRLAHYFVDGLETRLNGGRAPQHKTMAGTTWTDSFLLKALKMYLTHFPFSETSYFFANQMIMEVAGKANTLHIIHFNIMHGLQWSPFIQRLSERPGGPPKLRITAIDFPQAGYRPDARVKETGRRLSDYCKEYNVPFEYNYLSKNWETVKLEDIRFEKGEVVAINCMYHMKYVFDAMVMEQNPRDIVFDLMRSINPSIFVHVITNGAHGTPFFNTRFREALSYFWVRFDMFDTILPRESPERMVFEREVWGRELINVIASEGLHRKERPETFRQWYTRTTRAGFEPIPLNPTIVNEIRARVKLNYHKDFYVDEAGPWLLDGWKGKTIFALSCWRPAKSRMTITNAN